MKLLVVKISTDINKAVPLISEAIKLASEFYCKTETKEWNIFITKNSELTDDEFSVLAGKLVMLGFNVELGTAKPATPISADEQKHLASFFRTLEKRDKKLKQRAKPKSIWHY